MRRSRWRRTRSP
uniref:Uncharacterized protein n=1 Tax=Arundo donax TaxID=35708 RepID=A0A0A9AMV0_ARUDO